MRILTSNVRKRNIAISVFLCLLLALCFSTFSVFASDNNKQNYVQKKRQTQLTVGQALLNKLASANEEEKIDVIFVLNGRYILPDYDYGLLKRENRGSYLTHEKPASQDPVAIYCTAVRKAVEPLLCQCIDLSDDACGLSHYYSLFVEGSGTPTQIKTLMELDEIEEIDLAAPLLPNSQGGCIRGDVDSDGEITARDARLALRASARLEDLPAERFATVDLDGDGKVTAAEARKILRVSAKLETL